MKIGILHVKQQQPLFKTVKIYACHFVCLPNCLSLAASNKRGEYFVGTQITPLFSKWRPLPVNKTVASSSSNEPNIYQGKKV